MPIATEGLSLQQALLAEDVAPLREAQDDFYLDVHIGMARHRQTLKRQKGSSDLFLLPTPLTMVSRWIFC